jgi:dTDP-glucose pyrophosphorylase
MKALILAAGFGSRVEKGFNTYNGPHIAKLRELVYDEENDLIRHKGLIPINGQELVSHQLEQLRQAGVDSANIYVHTNAIYHQQYCEWAEKVGIPRTNIFNNGVQRNEDRREQMGDLLLALKNITLIDSLIVIACDTLVYDQQGHLHDLSNVACGYQKDRMSRVVCYRKDKDLFKHVILEVDEKSHVIGFEEKPECPKSNLVCASIYFFNPLHVSMMLHSDYLFKEVKNPLEIIGSGFFAEEVVSRLDIGTIEDILKANQIEVAQ